MSSALKRREVRPFMMEEPAGGRKVRGLPALRARSGFTLVELVVVMFLLGVLAAMAVTVYFKFIYKTRETVAISHIHRIIKAQELYRTDNDTYTDDFDELDMPGTAPAGSGNNVRIYEGYRYTLSVSNASNGEPIWSLRVEPEDGNTKMRWFYTDQTGTIRYEVGHQAGPTSPII